MEFTLGIHDRIFTVVTDVIYLTFFKLCDILCWAYNMLILMKGVFLMFTKRNQMKIGRMSNF